MGNRIKLIPGIILACFAVSVFFSGICSAQDDDSKPPLLNLDLELSSAYVFRGLNLFMESSNLDQNFILAPSVTWHPVRNGLSLGYWGGYQISGNIGENIDNGSGLEQDFILKYEEIPVFGNFSLTPSLNFYLYPFADSAAAGTRFPVYIDPMLEAGYSTALADFGLGISYYLGIQSQIRGGSYFYINPSVSKSFEFSESTVLELSSGFGYKIFKDRNINTENVYDILFRVSFETRVSDKFYINPLISLAWTNLDNTGLSNELACWWGLHFGLYL